MLMGRLKTYLPKTWRSSIGVLLGITAISIYTLPCMAENLPSPEEQTSAASMEDMQRELRALKAQVESLRAELGATKQQQEAKTDEELFASRQEFSQLSKEVQGLKQQQPEVVATLKDQIKKEMGFLPNAYNELSNKIRIGMELRTRGEYSNGFNTPLAHQFGLARGQTGQRGLDPIGTATAVTNTDAAVAVQRAATQIGPFNKGAAARKSADQALVLNRVRVNIDADVHDNLRAFVQFQDSRFWGMEGSPLGQLLDQPNNRIDLHQAYFDVRKIMGKNLTLRVGRQEIIWGAHRMMGDFGWSNIGFTWDAVRALWETDRYAAQAFASIQNHPGYFTPGSSETNEIAGSVSGGAAGVNPAAATVANSKQDDSDHQTFGAMFTFKKLVPNATLELMYLMDNDQQERLGTGFVATQTVETGLSGTASATSGSDLGEMEVHDVGFRLPGKVGKAIDYETENHFQFGEFRGQTHRASAHMVKGGYTLDKMMWSPRVGYEFDWSPGDGDPSDQDRTNVAAGGALAATGGHAGNVHHTFHQFYPTNHAHFGYIDLLSWKNMRAHRLQLNAKHTKKLRSQVDFWYFDLDNTNDGWYNAGQAMLRRFPSGTHPQTRAGAPNAGQDFGARNNPGRHLGKEVDFTLWYDLYKNVGIMAGYSRFVSGSFIQQTVSDLNSAATDFRSGPGGKDMDTDWGFLQMTVSF